MTDRTRGLKDILWVLAMFGLVAMVFRLWFGLGATTNLTDQVPWGLWKILNMVAGVALATSGFTIGFLVYVLKIESLRPMVKPAILVAFLGYGSSVFALMLDIGIPYRIWHAIVMWNEHSFLFEVAWCVMIYFTVTIIELSPTFLERFGLQKLAKHLHKISFGVVVLGISLSCLHHSSLGSLFLVTPERLHSLWFTPRLPFLFIMSAAGAGLMVAVLAKMFHSWVYDPADVFGISFDRRGASVCATGQESDAPIVGPDFPMVQRMAKYASWVLGAYLVLKVADLIATGALPHLLAMTWESCFYIGEVLFLAVIPLLLMLYPGTRRTPSGLGFAAASTALGLVWNRLNVGIFGYFHDAGSVYFPSLAEWALSLGILAAAGLVFLFVCEHLPIFDEEWKSRQRARAEFNPAFDRASGVWYRTLSSGLRRATAIAVVTIPLAWVVMYPPFQEKAIVAGEQVSPPTAVDVERAVLKLDGNKTYLAVTFPHREHQRRLGGEASCTTCHHLSMPADHSTPCSRCHRNMTTETRIFQHTSHFDWVARQKELTGLIPANNSCTVCHTGAGARSASTAVTCLECHQTDMRPMHAMEAPHGMQWASGYQSAMHTTCIGCHRKEASRAGRADLAACSNCHQDRINQGDRLALVSAIR